MLRLNLDGTSICLFQGDVKGTIFAFKWKPPVQRVALGKRRTYLTHIALVCDRPNLQDLMPQVMCPTVTKLSSQHRNRTLRGISYDPDCRTAWRVRNSMRTRRCNLVCTCVAFTLVVGTYVQ